MQGLEIHTASVHEGKKRLECIHCNARFSQKQGLEIHFASVHEGKNLLDVYYAMQDLVEKEMLNVTLRQCMKKLGHLNVKYVV